MGSNIVVLFTIKLKTQKTMNRTTTQTSIKRYSCLYQNYSDRFSDMVDHVLYPFDPSFSPSSYKSGFTNYFSENQIEDLRFWKLDLIS